MHRIIFKENYIHLTKKKSDFEFLNRSFDSDMINIFAFIWFGTTFIHKHEFYIQTHTHIHTQLRTTQL